MIEKKCYCGSDKLYNNCCKGYIELFYKKPIDNEDLLLTSWLKYDSYGHMREFNRIFQKYIFRIAHYYNFLENITYFVNKKYSKKDTELIMGIQLNIRHSILSALNVSATGLFLQSGIILRSAFEDILVLFDIEKNKISFEVLDKNRYKIKGILSRIKHKLPEQVVKWYGYLSSNFTHYNIIHTTPYMPTKCHADNVASFVTFQNILWTLCTYHIVLEYLYYDFIHRKIFWINGKNEPSIEIEKTVIHDWLEMFKKEIKSEFNPNERKAGLQYSERDYKFKQ